jgi:shikimate dehydrogenase
MLVNTTPIGMHPHTDISPLERSAIALLPQGAVVYDLIYTPQPTKLLAIAAELGYQAIDGLEMLVQQGAAALNIWLGEDITVQVMRKAAQAQLRA